ncbi:MAG TPA: HAMP domain-containing sensor histidine kinase, partial [Gemmatimonadales bacterium]|nr:HAMP domain-containing sensor histidine kinase [Gemmatimonadales bacterium]
GRQKTVNRRDTPCLDEYLASVRHAVHFSRPVKLGSRPPRPRGAFIAVLLVLTLVLAGVIALEAYRNFLGHKATAERVLHDYARLAAARFANRTEMSFYYDAFSPATDALARAKATLPNVPLPAPSHLPATTQPHAPDFRKFARYTFRYDLRSAHLETAGGTPSAAVRKWLRDTLPLHSRTVYDPKEHVGAIVRTVDTTPRAIVYTVVNDKAGAPRTVVGLEEDPRGLEPLYKAESEQYPMLPKAITGEVTEDSVSSTIVTAADGRELYRSHVQYLPTFAARDSFEHPMMGGLRVQVALRPDLAPKLVIGGMPRSNVPMLVALLALTAVLVVAALLQLWREYDLARLRTDFVSGVSHELRTPLAQIRMFSETLLLGRVRSAAERLRSLEIIDQEARRLTHLVENLLHFSRSERQATRLSPAPAPLGVLVRQAVEAFSPLAAARGATLRTELAEGLVAPVDADALRQMLLNLLDNAVKYGPAAQTITVGLEASDGRARIRVEDEGPGIPAADRERVWDRFWRLERDRGSAVAGTGIGLSVVRELVALHGGRAWVDDAHAGAGACFVLELPLQAAPERVPGTSPIHADLGAAT